MHAGSQNILSISQISNQVKHSLEKNFSNVWVRGEVASFKSYPSGHSYLTLKDENSEISAVIFSQYLDRISHKPNPGMEVLVMGDLSIYEPRGQFQLHIKSLYLSGEGELWLAFENLKKKLELEGIFDTSKKKIIPRFPRKIGIITSAEGAALRDILQVLNRRAPHVRCYVYPVSVQGSESAKQISIAIEDMNKSRQMDLLIIGRGGGSLEDLWSFNEEIVVRSIFASKIPIISAVGHETDTTLSDFAADYRAPTPSAAAELASVSRDQIIQSLDQLQNRLMKNINLIMVKYFEKVRNLKTRHGFYKPQIILETWKEKIIEKNNHLIQGLNKQVQIKMNNLELMENKLNLLNPQAQLKRGYVLAIDENKKIIHGINQLEIDDVFQLMLSNGKLKAKVLDKRNKNV